MCTDWSVKKFDGSKNLLVKSDVDATTNNEQFSQVRMVTFD